GSEVFVEYLDVTDYKAFCELVDSVVEKWQRIDVFVHAAAVMPMKRFDETEIDDLWVELDVNLGGLINGSKAVWKIMREQNQGHIIGIASGASFRGHMDEVMYCTAKHAQEGFVKSLAMEAKDFNIAVNTVGPGKTLKPTSMTIEEASELPLEIRSSWTDPSVLGNGFVWLTRQGTKFTGLRFDAGPIVDSIDSEGWEFEFTAQKVTSRPKELHETLDWQSKVLGE
ncbi:SDR family oxidoreductase, partial [SAR202 cluster bacterium AC-409-J13_OGT_754m]|nr:SDR family oxidoreductase [SAR202 cluster bacterium AC-409-J13_OGT_754m]